MQQRIQKNRSSDSNRNNDPYDVSGHQNFDLPTGKIDDARDSLASASDGLNDIDSVLSQNGSFNNNVGSESNPSYGGNELASKEQTAGEESRLRGSANDDEESANFAPSLTGGKDAKTSLRGRVFTKKNALLTTAAGILVGGGFGLLGVISGPAQLIALAQSIGRLGDVNETTSRVTTRRFLVSGAQRAINTGDIGETRVTILGSRRFANVDQQLRARGINFERNAGGTGQVRSLVIRAGQNAQFRSTNPDLNQSLAESRRSIARFYGVDELRVRPIGDASGGSFSVDVRGLKTAQIRSIAATSLASLEDGRIATALNMRIFTKFLNAPSLFNPGARATAAVQNRLETRAVRLAREAERRDTKRFQLNEKYVNAKNTVASRIAPHSLAIGNALLVTGALCAVRQVADLVPIVNFGQVVLPSIAHTADMLSVAGEIQAGETDLDRVGDVVESFTDDEGRSIWEGKALDSLVSGGSGSGQDISTEYKQAFTSATTGNAIIDTIADNDGTGLLCSWPGLLAQALASGVLVVIGPGGWGVKAAQVGVGGLATAAVVSYLQGVAIDSLTAESVASFAGPEGGNLLAYGAAATYGATARSNGGVALNDAQIVAIRESAVEYRNQLQSEQGFFARTLDPKNHRSLTSKFARSTSGSLQNIINRSFASLINPVKTIGSISSAFQANVGAQSDEPYEFNMPIYGIPLDILESDRYADPFENAERAASVFTTSKGDDLRERAFECFGAEISKGSFGWDSVPETEVIPTEKSYLEARCDDLSDQDWVDVMVFVNDSHTLKAIDCYEGDVNACTDIGASIDGGVSNNNNTTLSGLENVTCPTNMQIDPAAPAGYYIMPEATNGEYIIYAAQNRRSGSQQMVCVLHSVAMAYKQAMGDQSTLRIGNLNTPLNSPSQSHRWGVANDQNSAAPLVAGKQGPGYSEEATIILGKIWVDTGMLKNIWWCPPDANFDGNTNGRTQNEIRAYAQSKGETINIKCINGHRDHFHVDIKDEFRLPEYL